MSMTIHPHCQNQRRAACAKAALAAYQRVQNGGGSCEAEPKIETLIDILTDLRHWADQNGFDFNHATRVAEYHFDHETCTEQ